MSHSTASTTSTQTIANDAGDPDVVSLLTRQHRQLEDLLTAMAEAQTPGDRRRCFALAADELAVHLRAEEQVFFPAVRAERTEDILLESLEEHLSLKRLVSDLLALDPDDATWPAKAKVLQEQSVHHHKEEEEHLFPKVRRLFDEQRREALGQSVLDHEQRLQQQGQPREVIAAQTDSAAPLPETSTETTAR